MTVEPRKPGKVYYWRTNNAVAALNVTYRVWAEDGMVHAENQTTGEFTSQSVAEVEAVLRQQGPLAVKLMRDGEGLSGTYAADDRTEGRHQMSMARILFETLQEAKAQGDPTDPVVARQRAREERVVQSTPVSVIQRQRGPGGAAILVPPAVKGG